MRRGGHVSPYHRDQSVDAEADQGEECKEHDDDDSDGVVFFDHLDRQVLAGRGKVWLGVLLARGGRQPRWNEYNEGTEVLRLACVERWNADGFPCRKDGAETFSRQCLGCWVWPAVLSEGGISGRVQVSLWVSDR